MHMYTFQNIIESPPICRQATKRENRKYPHTKTGEKILTMKTGEKLLKENHNHTYYAVVECNSNLTVTSYKFPIIYAIKLNHMILVYCFCT